MNAATIIYQAQKELIELHKIMDFDVDTFCGAEMQIDINAETYDGSETISEFVDRCVELASIS